MQRTAPIIALVLLLTSGLLEAQQPRRKSQDELASEGSRPPPPGVAPRRSPRDSAGFVDTARSLLGESWSVVTEWQAALARRVPGPVAWAVVALPLWLVLLLIVLRIRRRRRPPPPAKTRDRPGAPKKSKAAKTKKARTRSDSSGLIPALQDPREHTTLPPLTLSPAHGLLMMSDDAQVSLHETLVVLGPGEATFNAFVRAARSELDPVMWAAAVKDQRCDRLRPLQARWIRETAAARVSRWLSHHPRVIDSGLQVSMPSHLEVNELKGLTLTEPSGLGASINDDLQELLQQARRGMTNVLEGHDPYVFFTGSRRARLPALFDDREGAEVGKLNFQLALLLHGLAALARGVEVEASGAGVGKEFRHAIAEHQKLVGEPVTAEGCAVHAIHQAGGSKLRGIGMMLAAVAGASYSAMAVVMRLSKLAGGIDDPGREQAMVRLGQLVAEDLEDKSGAVITNVRRLVGLELLGAEKKRSVELARVAERAASKQPLWPGSSDLPTPEVALAKLHRNLVDHSLTQAAAAERRWLEILDKLMFVGKDGGNQHIASRRLGYAVSGLGMELLRSASTELLSTGRELLAAAQS